MLSTKGKVVDSVEELKAIADAIEVTFAQSFTLPDGTQFILTAENTY